MIYRDDIISSFNSSGLAGALLIKSILPSCFALAREAGRHFVLENIMRVNICSNCEKRFWSKSGNDDVCFDCFHKAGYPEPEKLSWLPVFTPRLKKIERPKPEPRKVVGKPGYVYVMKSVGMYKIGMTSRKSGRLDEIKRMVPVLKLMCQIACDDAGAVETYLHKKYKKQRITHEWYKLNKEDLKWFKSLKDHDLDEDAKTIKRY